MELSVFLGRTPHVLLKDLAEKMRVLIAYQHGDLSYGEIGGLEKLASRAHSTGNDVCRGGHAGPLPKDRYVSGMTQIFHSGKIGNLQVGVISLVDPSQRGIGWNYLSPLLTILRNAEKQLLKDRCAFCAG
jgi:hypothetical protein